jgi:hypothetical protein
MSSHADAGSHFFWDMTVVICEQYVAPFLDSLRPEANAATSS